MKRTILLGFFGWCDAGNNVKFLMEHIISKYSVRESCEWNIEKYWHSGIERPKITVKYGIIRKISWPSIRFFYLDSGGNLQGIAFGPEPTHNWKNFSLELVEKIQSLDFERIILLGSLYDQILHDEAIVSGVVTHPRELNIIRSLGCQLIEYEGPSAIHSQIMLETASHNLETLSLWMHIPFYLKGPHEKVIAKLFDVINILTDANFSTEELLDKWEIKRRELEKLLSNDEELKGVLNSIKQKEQKPFKALPSASSMAPDHATTKIINIEEFIKRKKNDEKSHDN